MLLLRPDLNFNFLLEKHKNHQDNSMNYSSMSKWSKRPVLSMETQTESSLKIHELSQFSIHEPKNNQNNENFISITKK